MFESEKAFQANYFLSSNIVYFLSSAERRILTQERVATRAEFPRIVSYNEI